MYFPLSIKCVSSAFLYVFFLYYEANWLSWQDAGCVVASLAGRNNPKKQTNKEKEQQGSTEAHIVLNHAHLQNKDSV